MTKAEAIKELMRCAEICPTTPLAEACRMAAEALQFKDVEQLGAVPVRHGHWVRWYEAVYDSFGVGYAPHYKCSECDTEYDQYDAMRMNYCPNCGARMDWKDGDNHD